MKKTIGTTLMAALVILGLLMTVSCAKKSITSHENAMENNGDNAKNAQDLASIEEERIKSQAFQEQLREKELKKNRNTARQQFLNQHIYFEFDSYNLGSKAKILLTKKTEWLDSNQGIAITIEGHCDQRGTIEYNLALGERRAMAVKNYLQDLGVSASRMTLVSYGEEKPIQSGLSDEIHRKNRRAQIILQ